jgi:hypothetical protein
VNVAGAGSADSKQDLPLDVNASRRCGGSPSESIFADFIFYFKSFRRFLYSIGSRKSQ